MAQKKNEEAVATLAIVWPDFDIQVDDLIKPTTVGVIKFFEKLLNSMEIDIEQIKMSIIQHTSHFDAYQDLLYYYVLYRCTNRILNRLELYMLVRQSFTISDILCPTPKRHRHVTMLISNCLLYINNLFAHITNPTKYRINDKILAIEKLHKEKDELKAQANMLVVQYSDFEKSHEKVEKNIREALVHYENQRQEQGNIREENCALKKDIRKVEAEKKLLMEILRKEKTEENELNQLLVEDYEAIISERECLEKELAEGRSNETDYAVNLDMKNDSELKYNTFATTLDEFLEQEPFKSIPEIYEDLNSMKVSRAKLKEEFQSLRTLQSDLHFTVQKLQEESNTMEEELQAMQVKMDAKLALLEQEIKQLEEERHKIDSKQMKNNQKSNEIIQEIQRAVKYGEANERNFHDLIEFHQKMYKKILENTGGLHNEVDQILKEIKSCSEQFQIQ